MNCICAKTRRTARLLSRFYDDRLRPCGMTVAQFELLSELTGQPDRPQAELADHVGIDQTTLSRNLKAMIGYGWLTSAPPLKDKRQTRYALTAKGQKILQLAIPHWQQAHDHVLKQMGPDWQTAWDQLSRLTLALST